MFSFVSKDLDFAHKLDKPSAPTEEYYKHIHPFNEILFLVRGNVNYTVESETRKLNDGDIVFIPSGKYHFATIDLSVPYERYVCKFPDSIVPDYIKEKMLTGSSFFNNKMVFSGLLNQFDLYAENYSREETITLFTSDILKLLVLLCHDVRPAAKHDDFIDELISFLHKNIDKHITIEMLSKEFHYSKSFINNEFRKHMKIPLMQYVRSKKIIGAYQMILGGMRKNEAAEMFGFETYSTFYRAYQKFIKNNYDFYDNLL